MTTGMWIALVFLVTSVGIIGAEYVDIQHLKSTNSQIEAELTVVTNEEKEAKVVTQMRAEKVTGDLSVIANQRDSAIKANQLTGTALTNSVRQYEANRGARSLCKATNPKVVTRYVVGDGSTTTDQLLATIPSTCQAVIDDALACKAALKTCQN